MRVLILRPGEEAAASAETARKFGFEPVTAPAISIVRMEADARAIDALVQDSCAAVFMSRRSVALLGELFPLSGRLSGITVIAVGETTAAELRRRNIFPEIPARHSSAGIADHILAAHPECRTVSVFRSSSGSGVLGERLAEAGIQVHEIPLYRIEPVGRGAVLEEAIRAIAGGERFVVPFTSSMVVRSVFRAAASIGMEDAFVSGLGGCVVISIGEETSRELGRRGIGFTESTLTDFENMLREASRRL
jgi:uroporphyrinogen-III synthase